MADGFVFFSSYYEAIREIKTKKDRLLLFETICKYALYGELPKQLPSSIAGNFILMKPNIDQSIKRRKASVSNGSKGGAPEGNQNAKKQPKNNLTEQPNNNLDKDKELDKELDKEKDGDMDITADKPPRTRFCPPSVEEVREYCKERGNNVDPEKFVDYYTANGWMAGKNKMKDWRAAVRNWERNNFDNGKDDAKHGSTKGHDLSDAAAKWSGPEYNLGIVL